MRPKDTADEQMISGLWLLAADDSSVIILQAMTFATLRGPKPVVRRKPEKELSLFSCQLSLSVLACLKRSRISSRCPLKFDHDKTFEPVYNCCDGLIISGFNEGLLNWSYRLSSPHIWAILSAVHSSENRPTKWLSKKKGGDHKTGLRTCWERAPLPV
jgi:hypothetical protein